MFEEVENRKFTRTFLYEKWLVIRYLSLSLWEKIRPKERARQAYSTIYVIFRGGERDFYQRFLSQKFTHVFLLEDIIKQHIGQGILQLEFLRSRISATHLPLGSVDSYLKDLKKEGCTVLKVSPFDKVSFLGSIFPRFIPYNCVSLAKQCLGIRAIGKITPRQLYKHLIKHKNVRIL